jgi:predicted nuclease of restriction endonuclease-like (RecB) superfamily
MTKKSSISLDIAKTPDDRQLVVTPLANELRQMIEDSKRVAVVAVNASLTLLYWRIGERINSELVEGMRAAYGAQIVSTLSRQLSEEYGRAFSEKGLRHMMRFAQSFADYAIVSTLSRQLAWSHFMELIYHKDPLARDFYAQMCQMERWSVRTLRERVDSMLFERTALSKKPEELIALELKALRESGEVTPALIFKDPYVLDFVGLQDRYLEKDLEDAILRELEHFLLELGAGFSFVARQKRIQLDSDDFYIDLLFYNRKLRRLIALDLKIGDFKAEYKGQMELYLRWLAKYDQEPSDQPPLGIILCTGKKHEQIELLELDKAGIHVADYLTVLPPREVFEQKIQSALLIAQERFALRETP